MRLLLVFLLVGLSGCALLESSSPSQFSPQDHYNRYLPRVQTVGHLDSLMLKPGETLLGAKMRWSSSYEQSTGSWDFEPQRYHSFATLMGRDVVEATLRTELGIQGLSPDLQERLRREQQQALSERIAFDVHIFQSNLRSSAMSDTDLDGPGSTIILRDGEGNRYSPVRISSAHPDVVGREAGQREIFHRTNRVEFDRVVDGRDILDDAESLTLIVRLARGASNEIEFNWRFADGE